MVEIFASVFGLVQAGGLQSKISSFGGCFAFRQQRTGAKLSTHSWGIAIDLNIGNNPQGSSGDMDTGFIEIFRERRIRVGRRLVRQDSRSDAFPVLFGILRLMHEPRQPLERLVLVRYRRRSKLRLYHKLME